MPTSIPTSDIRNNWSDIVSRAQYAGERFVVERHGTEVAVIVPVEDLGVLEDASSGAVAGADVTAPEKAMGRSNRDTPAPELTIEDHIAVLRDHVRDNEDPQRELSNLIYRLIEGSDVEARKVLIAAAYLCE